MFAKCNINQTVNMVDNDNICHISSDSEYFYDLPIYSGKVINYLFTEYIFPWEKNQHKRIITRVYDHASEMFGVSKQRSMK